MRGPLGGARWLPRMLYAGLRRYRSVPKGKRDVLEAALLGLSYWLAAVLSLHLALVRGQVTPIWPPTGIALVGILVLGRRVWPAIFLGALAVNLPLGPSPPAVAFIAAGNTLAPLVSAELLARAGFRLELDRLRDALAIIVLGALIGMTISATIGTSVLILFGSMPLSNVAGTWSVWWTGDAMGVLLVAPFLLSLWPRPGTPLLHFRDGLQLAGLLTAIGILTYILFLNPFRLEYLVFPLIMVAAWRFRLRGAAPAALMASVVAIWAAANGDGPFASQTLLEKMITLQAFNISVSFASFALALFVDTREQRLELARRYESASLAIKAKTDAINLAAQELNAPLAILNSYMAILSDGQLGPAPAKWSAALGVISDKAWQVNWMVEELLDAARIESSAVPSRRSRVDLRDVVRKSVKRARVRSELTGARIEATVSPRPLHVDADAGQLGRILDNLLSNGLRFTERLPLLRVTALVESEQAVVRVADNGVGLSPDEQGRVFEPFHRPPGPGRGTVHGSGLGLYLGRRLAQANGGSLVIEDSAPGRGTNFALILPLVSAEGSRKTSRQTRAFD